MGEILLVIPPAPYMTSDRAFPPLGILYVASYLKKNGRDVKICDLTGCGNWKEVFERKIKQEKPDYIGITATTPDMPIVTRLLKISRRILPFSRIIIGGSHPTIVPQTCKGFDCVVVGDGWRGSLKAFSEYRNKIVKEKLIKNLDEIPFPARELIELRKYHYSLNSKKATNIITHLGCPYQCIFCAGRNSDFYTRIRFRSPENVLEEMDYLHSEYGYDAFVFYDDEFNLKKEYIFKLCRLLLKRKYIWRAAIRSDLIDNEIALLMRKAGCVEVTVGVESGSEKILNICKKGITPEINSRARKICFNNGIRFKAFVIVGLPGATEEDEKITEKWLVENRPDDVDININVPYPATPEFAKADKYKLIFNYNWTKNPISYKYHPLKYKNFCSNTYMNASKILKIRNKLARKFSSIFFPNNY